MCANGITQINAVLAADAGACIDPADYMSRVDALYLEDLCSGSRRMVDYLAKEGIPISRDRVRSLIRRRRNGRSTRNQAPTCQGSGRAFPMEMALSVSRQLEIFRSDQGCQFSSGDFGAKKCRQRRSRSAGHVRNAATTTPWWNGRSAQYVLASVPARLQRWLGG